MAAAMIRTLYQRHWWANGELLDAVARLGEAEAARDMGDGFTARSLKGVLFHVYGVDRLWLSRWNGVSPTAAPEEAAEAPTLAALRARWEALEAEQAAFLDALGEHDLRRVVEYRLISGAPGWLPLETLLHHVPDHGTHHRSEINTMLSLRGTPPPETGLARFATVRAGR